MSLQHPLKLFHPSLNFNLQHCQLGKNLLRQQMLDGLMRHLLGAVDGEAVALGGNVSLGHAEALVNARTLPFCGLTLLPTGEGVGQVVLGVFSLTKGLQRCHTELLFEEQRLTLAIKAPAIS